MYTLDSIYDYQRFHFVFNSVHLVHLVRAKAFSSSNFCEPIGRIKIAAQSLCADREVRKLEEELEGFSELVPRNLYPRL